MSNLDLRPRPGGRQVSGTSRLPPERNTSSKQNPRADVRLRHERMAEAQSLLEAQDLVRKGVARPLRDCPESLRKMFALSAAKIEELQNDGGD